MTYRFKPLPELYWSVITAAAVVLLLELAALNPDGIKDWRTWAVALGVAMVRAAAGAALDWIRRSMAPEPDPMERLKADLLALTPTERDRLAADLETHGRIEARTVRQAPHSSAGQFVRPGDWH